MHTPLLFRRGPRLTAVLLLVLALSSSAALAAVRIGLGADYWANNGGIFQANMAVDTQLVRHLSLGGRFGFGIVTPDDTLVLPIDLDLRLHLAQSRVYLEGLVGPWILFARDNPVRAHAALGFGLETGGINFGLEGGWLDAGAIIGLRLAFRI